MAGGRPTKYTATIQKKAEKYLTECGNEYFDYHKTQGAQSNSFERKVKVKLPTNEGLALYLNITDSTLYLWQEKHPEFSDTLAKIKRIQKEMLIAGGINGDYSPVISKLLLASNHGMSDKQEIDHTSGGKVIKGVNVILDKAYGDGDSDEEE